MNSQAKTVLIIDDSTLVRRQVKEALAAAGYETLEASSGSSGLALLQNQQVALVITDVTMPEMSGLELIQALRAGTVHDEVPVVVLSTLGTAALVEQGWKLGIKAWLKKPFKPAMLVAAVHSLLSPARGSAEVCAS